MLNFISDIANIKLTGTPRIPPTRSRQVGYGRFFASQTHVKYEGFCVFGSFSSPNALFDAFSSEIALRNRSRKRNAKTSSIHTKMHPKTTPKWSPKPPENAYRFDAALLRFKILDATHCSCWSDFQRLAKSIKNHCFTVSYWISPLSRRRRPRDQNDFQNRPRRDNKTHKNVSILVSKAEQH